MKISISSFLLIGFFFSLTMFELINESWCFKPQFRKPSIDLNCPVGSYGIDLEELYLSGTVSAATRLEYLEVNGEKLNLLDDLYWQSWVPLNMGENEIRIKAGDAFGSTQSMILSVTRESAISIDKSLLPRTVLIPDFNPTSDENMDRFAMRLSGELMRIAGFRMLERENLDSILEELQLSLSGLTDTRFMVRVGRLKVADHIITIKIKSDNERLVVFCKLVSVDAEEPLWSAAYQGLANSSELSRMAKGIASDLKRMLVKLPTTLIDDSGWPLVYLNRGFQAGVRNGIKAIAIDPDGLTLKGEVVELLDCCSKVEFKNPPTRLKAGSKVYLIGFLAVE